jgi:transposase-like protein
MKPIGRSPKPLTEDEKQMILEYLTSDKSLKEVAEQHGISDAGLRYKVKKYRKETENVEESSK